MTVNKTNIVFIGMMGTYKTAVSRLVAAQLGRPVYDTDELFESRYGAIQTFFERYGEAAFRDRERDVVMQVAQNASSVISTGGGAVLRPDNMSALKQTGIVVLLTASPEAICARVQGGVGRPLLNGDTTSNIVRILHERKALYASYADYEVDNTSMTPEICAQAVLRALQGENL